jgi:dipeptidyl aminopeptidase/acylaminoacyl peptidase
VCSVYLRRGSGRDVEEATRLVTVGADGSNMEQLTAQTRTNAYFDSNYGGRVIDYKVPGSPQAVLVTRYFGTENRTGTLTSSSDEGLGVEQVDVVTLERKRVEAPRDGAFWYATDGQGNVRLMGTQPTRETGYVRRQQNYSFRPAGAGWSPLSQVTFDAGLSTGFEPVAVDATENVAYGFDNNGHFTALYKLALDGSGTRTLVLGRDDTDVDGLIRIGRNQRIVGASYATDRRVAEYFDPEIRQLASSLQRVLGGRTVNIIDATSDEQQLVIFASSDTDPGDYYLYDKTTRKLAQLLPARPELVGVPLGQMRAVQYPAADGTMIPGYLTLPAGSDGKNLKAIVLPHGGPGARDEWGFDWLSQYFASKGYAVLQPNFRGSTGYGDEWFRQNGFRSWETAIGDINAAGHWLEDQGIAAPGKLAIFGWSYGGYAALQSQVLDPNLLKAVVAVAPVTDLDRLRQERVEYADYSIVDNFIGNGPHVEAGSPARHASAFTAPVLLFHGDADTNVGVGESRLMRDRLKDAGKRVEYVEFKGLDHQLDDAGARTRLLSESERFIAAALRD